MADLMGHHSSDFGFVIGIQDQAGIDVEESARKRESVDAVVVDHLDGERHFCVGIANQVLAEPVHIFGDDRVLNEMGTRVNLLGVLMPHVDLALDAVPVPHTAPASHVAVADGGHILDAAVMIDVLLVRFVRRSGPSAGGDKHRASRQQEETETVLHKASSFQLYAGTPPYLTQSV